MPNKNTNRRQVKKSNLPVPPAVPTARVYVDDFTAEELKQALLPYHQVSCPLGEMIQAAEAAFTFMQTADMDLHIRNAFGELEKMFNFYKNLVELAVPNGLRVAKTA